jgi:tetratricopeptide (TPR) repeat protein
LISHWYWQNRLPWDTRPWIAPHIPAELSFADYAARRDPAWDAILRYKHEPGIEDAVRDAAARGGKDAIASAYRDYQSRHPDRWGRTNENAWNAAGYALMGEGKKTEALEVFRLNAEAYPASANTWDSLAEAHLESGNHENAIRYYRKALDVNPDFQNAARMLARLTGTNGGAPAGAHH